MTVDAIQHVHQEFIYWQCQLRKYSARKLQGRPTTGLCPELVVDDRSMGSITTILLPVKAEVEAGYLNHLYKTTYDPGERRTNAIRYFQSGYYQQPGEFSGELSASAPVRADWMNNIIEAEIVELIFEQDAREWQLPCEPLQLDESDSRRQFTLAHNRLFNSYLAPDTGVILFSPVWEWASKR